MSKVIFTSDEKNLITQDNKIIQTSETKEEKLMASKFKFKIFTKNPDASYAAIATKDPLTFYLLSNGKGYFGDTLLFDSTAETGSGTSGVAKEEVVFITTAGEIPTPYQTGKLYAVATTGALINAKEVNPGVYYAASETVLTNVSDEAFTSLIAKYITNNAVKSADALAENYAGDENTLMTSKAVVDYVKQVASTNSLIKASFFKKVELHTITQEELDATENKISVADGVTAGETGLLFTADTDNDDTNGGTAQYFISLKNYIDVYTGGATNSTKTTVSDTNEINVDLNVNTNEKSILVDKNGVSLDKTTAIADGDGSEGHPAASADKLVTEKAIVDYINSIVMSKIDAKISAATKNTVEAETDVDATT